MKINILDKVVQGVVNTILSRSNLGLKKYGTNLNRTDLSILDWLNHAQEESLDYSLYLEKLKNIVSGIEIENIEKVVNNSYNEKAHEELEQLKKIFE